MNRFLGIIKMFTEEEEGLHTKPGRQVNTLRASPFPNGRSTRPNHPRKSRQPSTVLTQFIFGARFGAAHVPPACSTEAAAVSAPSFQRARNKPWRISAFARRLRRKPGSRACVARVEQKCAQRAVVSGEVVRDTHAGGCACRCMRAHACMPSVITRAHTNTRSQGCSGSRRSQAADNRLRALPPVRRRRLGRGQSSG